jgi:glycosyltransferase involved in cell wall biosynthesis
VRFSIITVVKNDKDKIKKTINSVNKQLFKDFEYIIIDGKSNDGTSEIIDKNLKDKKNIHRHIIKKDKNLYEALNYGIKISTGKYIVLLHSGDIFLNSKVLTLINKEIENYDVISGNIIYKNKGLFSRYWNYKIVNLNKFNCFKIAHTSLIIKKKLIESIKKYNTKYNISSDTDFILRLSSIKDIKYKYIDKTFVIMEAGGLSNSTKNLVSKILQDLQIYIKHFKSNFIFFYFLKVIYKLYKLIIWKIVRKIKLLNY